MTIELDAVKRELENYREALIHVVSLTYSTPRENEAPRVVERIRGVSNGVLNMYSWRHED